ncbi:DUF4340 domain-containing protein [Marinicella sediminis]|uniref:DUF4340 domain-containing protein n=1 Tax=Marinicella sediminis TaxID=1792834 RepID=A0ABV7J9I0_9GAMM|nr:DUF4340 domain-containing protein [Marinicella sediminis]
MVNNMKVLLGILIVVAGFAYFVIQQQSPDQAAEHSALVPEWQSQPEAVSQISRVVLSQNGETMELTKAQDHWILNGGFYANMEPLFSLLQSMKNARIVEVKTANPENHQRLDLADDDLRVSLYKGDELVKAVQLGKAGTAGTQFVRMAEEDQTYLVEGLKPVVFNEDSWTLKTVLNIPAEQINAVQIRPHEDKPFKVTRNPEDNQWDIQPLDEQEQLKDGVSPEVLSQGLTRLMIESAEQVDVSALTPVVTLDYALVDGSSIQLNVYQQADDYQLNISGSQWSHYEPWLMTIAEYKFTALNKTLSDFTELKTEPLTIEEEGE